MAELSDENDVIWRVGVYDAHCHPTDIMASLDDITNMKAQVLTVMATRSQDQHLVANAAERYPLDSEADLTSSSSKHVVPAFGWHPWFSHQMIDDRIPHQVTNPIDHYRSVLTPRCDDLDFLESLPQPISLSKHLKDMEESLSRFPLALVGEVGLDRSFRLPCDGFIPAGDMEAKTGGSQKEYTPGSREGRPLSPHRVSIEHQKAILRAQFELAGKLQRPVSVHSVQTHGLIFDLLQSMWKGSEKPSRREQRRTKTAPNAVFSEANGDIEFSNSLEKTLLYPPRICMHSYSGALEALSQFLVPNIPAEIYFSFSMLVNFSAPSMAKAESCIRAIPDDKLLVESDLHCAGERMDGLLKDIVIKICEIKGWKVEDGARQLKENWRRFVFGSDQLL